jgi:hypothetical protein
MGGGLRGLHRDEGVAPTFCRSPAPGAMGGVPRGFSLLEPRPRGDGWWSARFPPVGAPPPGRWVVVREVSPCRSPAPGAMGGGLRGFSRRGRRSYKNAALLIGI